jgi:hypothetical protein
MGLGGVLIEIEDSAMSAWTLTMQECGLSISLQQLKMKVAELTQTRVTQFSGWNTKQQLVVMVQV